MKQSTSKTQKAVKKVAVKKAVKKAPVTAKKAVVKKKGVKAAIQLLGHMKVQATALSKAIESIAGRTKGQTAALKAIDSIAGHTKAQTAALSKAIQAPPVRRPAEETYLPPANVAGTPHPPELRVKEAMQLKKPDAIIAKFSNSDDSQAYLGGFVEKVDKDRIHAMMTNKDGSPSLMTFVARGEEFRYDRSTVVIRRPNATEHNNIKVRQEKYRKLASCYPTVGTLMTAVYPSGHAEVVPGPCTQEVVKISAAGCRMRSVFVAEKTVMQEFSVIDFSDGRWHDLTWEVELMKFHPATPEEIKKFRDLEAKLKDPKPEKPVKASPVPPAAKTPTDHLKAQMQPAKFRKDLNHSGKGKTIPVKGARK